MRIISFAWTTGAFLAGRKTSTCRDWDDSYAKQFRKGDLVAAYDRSPRFSGTQIGTIRLTHDPKYGNWREILDDPYEQEGFAWYDEQIASGNAGALRAVKRGLSIPDGMTLKEWIDRAPAWGDWVIRFEVVSLAVPS